MNNLTVFDDCYNAVFFVVVDFKVTTLAFKIVVAVILVNFSHNKFFALRLVINIHKHKVIALVAVIVDNRQNIKCVEIVLDFIVYNRAVHNNRNIFFKLQFR